MRSRSSSLAIVSRSSFTDVSGAAARIGGFTDWLSAAPDGVSLDRGNVVRDSVVRRVATEFRGQCGVIVGYAADTTLAHLAVEDLPYSGVCVGWGWRRFRELARARGAAAPPPPARNNRVVHCRVARVKQALNDGGAIYALGPQPGSRIASNVIDELGMDGGASDDVGVTSGAAVYLDLGSGGFAVEDNVVLRVCEPCRWLSAPDEFSVDIRATRNWVKQGLLLVKAGDTKAGDVVKIRGRGQGAQDIVKLKRRRIDVAGNWKYDERAAAAVVEAAGPRLGSELELSPT